MEPYQQLEKEWAEWNGLDPAGMVACSSGTAALHLALEAFRLPQGSEVIVPDYTMIACPRVVTLAGLTPIFVDCRPNLLADPMLIGRVAHSAGTLMVVHVYGRRFDLDKAVSESGIGVGGWNDLMVVEDLAEAHGIRPHPGTDAACWSFYKNKIVAGEEGGAVWFRDKEHARVARSLRSLGFTDAHDFWHAPRGHNYRMSNAHAKLVLESLDWASGNVGGGTSIAFRRDIEEWYNEACPAEWRMPPRDAPWVYDLRITGMRTELQDELVKRLNREGIRARHGFKPMSVQEEYHRCRSIWNIKAGKEGMSEAALASVEVVYLPIQPGVTTKKDVFKAFKIMREVVARKIPRPDPS